MNNEQVVNIIVSEVLGETGFSGLILLGMILLGAALIVGGFVMRKKMHSLSVGVAAFVVFGLVFGVVGFSDPQIASAAAETVKQSVDSEINITLVPGDEEETSVIVVVNAKTANDSGLSIQSLVGELPQGVTASATVASTEQSNRLGEDLEVKLSFKADKTAQPGAYKSQVNYSQTDNYLPQKKFYDQAVEWGSCDSYGYDTSTKPPGLVTCSTVKAPLDWTSEDTTDIHLALLKVAARQPDKRLGTLFLNPGGPGASGMNSALGTGIGKLDTATYNFVADYYDIVGWDPRGVGNSSKIICDNIFSTEQAATNATNNRNTLIAAFTAHNASCLARSEDNVAAFADTQSTARDVNLLRSILGDDKLNYFGMSWGAILGGEIAGLFPTRLNRIVLDGVQSPNISSFDANVNTSDGAQKAFAAFFESCQNYIDIPYIDGPITCPFIADSVDDRFAEFDKELQDLDANPYVFTAGSETITVTGHKLYGVIYNMLFSGPSWYGIVTGLFQEGITRPASSVYNAMFLQPYTGYQGGATESSVASVFEVTSCEDRRISDSEEIEQSEYIIDHYPVVGKYQVDYNLVDINNLTLHSYSCLGLPDHDEIVDLSNPKIPPIILAAAVGDPATPYASGVKFAQELHNSVFLTYTGAVHCPFIAGDSLPMKTDISNYLITGVFPANGGVYNPTIGASALSLPMSS
jgi:pimeloyl-ACP methyl ester carboxylesterase